MASLYADIQLNLLFRLVLSQAGSKRKGQYLHDMRDGRMTPAREVIRFLSNKKHTMGNTDAEEIVRDVDLTGLVDSTPYITGHRTTE
jgi:hypothetical protein